jgi:hypothetical protein
LSSQLHLKLKMAPPQHENQSSHKRTRSTADNATALPSSKKQSLAGANPKVSEPATVPAQSLVKALKQVFVLEVDTIPGYENEEASSGVCGVYATLEDANNAVRKLVKEEYEHAEDAKHGTKADGTVWWSSEDVGDGEQVSVSIKIWDVNEAGSVPECAWDDNVRDCGAGED